MWRRSARASIGAVSEVYFPENDFGAPDWRESEMVSRTLEYMDRLPKAPRLMLYALFVAIQWLTPFLLAGVGRFSKRSLPFRERAIRRWNTWNFILFRYLADGLKAQLMMTYMSHVSVQRYMGVWKACEREADPYGTPIDADFFDNYTYTDAPEQLR